MLTNERSSEVRLTEQRSSEGTLASVMVCAIAHARSLERKLLLAILAAVRVHIYTV